MIGDFGYGPTGPYAHTSSVEAAHWGPPPLAAIAESYLSADGSPLFGILGG